MRIQRPTITAPTITEVQSLAGSGANITGSFQGAFDGTLTGATSASLALGVATNLASITALDDTYASDSQLTSVSSSLASDISVNASAIAGLDSTYATDAALNASSSTLQSSIDTKSSIAQLNASSSTLQGNVDTLGTNQTAALNTSSSTLQGNIDTIGSGQTSALNTSSSTLQGNINTLGTDQTAALNNSSSALQTNIDLKADIASPTFTGTVGGLSKSMVGLANVDNTTDALKPVSTAGQTALNLKANLAGPTFTGDVIAPTVTDGADSSTKVATTSFVQGRITALIGGAGEAFDTLLELSGSISNGDSDVVALTATVGGKLAKASNLSDLDNAETARGNLGLSNVANETRATILGGNHTGTLNSIAASTVTDGAALGATSNQDSTADIRSGTTAANVGLGNVTNESKATILGGNHTGTLNSIAASTVTSGAALGASANQDSTSTIRQGTTATDVGLGNVTNESKAQMFFDPTFSGTVSGVSKSHVGLSNVPNSDHTAQGYTTYTSNQATNTTSAVTFSSVAASGDIVAYSSSDNRLKDNIVNIPNAIEKVQQLNGVTWDWNDNADELQKSIPNVGVIAQEVEQVLPQLVKDRENGYKGVDYAKLTGLLIEAVKELAAQVEELSK